MGSKLASLIDWNPQLQFYYDSLESRIGYRLLLGGTRHFGWYESPSAWPFPIEPALRRMESRLLEGLDLPPGSRVLDCGCGIGHVALYIAKNGRLQVDAFDFMAHHVVKARRNITAAGMEGQVTARQMDYHHLEDLPSDHFDGLYTMETLVHSSDPKAVLSGFARVLKPGGVIVLHEYISLVDKNTAPWLREAFEQVCKNSYMPAWPMFTPGVLDGMLEDAGFEVERTLDFSKNIVPLLWLFFILAWLPYHIIRLLGLEDRFVNTVAGYVGYQARGSYLYVQMKARKR